MLDVRIDKVDLALNEIGPEQLARKVALWQWACREMLHETLTGMHQLSFLSGIAERVADLWHAPMDVLETDQPYMKRAALADRRLPQVMDGLGQVCNDDDRVRLWRLRYASLVATTLQGMQALADKHHIERQVALDGWH